MLYYIILYFIFTGNREDRVIVSKETGNPRTTLYDVVSSIHLVPTAEDDGVKYTCEAQHEALPDDMTLKTSVQLSVSCKFISFSLFYFQVA